VVPVFFSVAVCVVALVTPTVVDGKLRLDGVSVADDVAAADGQAFTRLATFSEPRPVVVS